ncbi:hypothetical protein [Methylocapsa aurea]|uniref:hypothetical protein n=1 Tax=Methylocapsa aurea TaxID=663610 RepID=UPI0012EBFE24|nr:hypothetical protein [Methylocapsa aurea]
MNKAIAESVKSLIEAGGNVREAARKSRKVARSASMEKLREVQAERAVGQRAEHVIGAGANHCRAIAPDVAIPRRLTSTGSLTMLPA